MMKQQSPEFLLGYLFSEIERKIIKDITGRDNSGLPRKPDTYTAQIPLLWFGITRPNSSYHNTPMVMLNVECMCDDLVRYEDLLNEAGYEFIREPIEDTEWDRDFAIRKLSDCSTSEEVKH